MKTDQPMFDRALWEHERQADQQDHDPPEMPVTTTPATTKSEEKRRRDNVERAGQGDRIDWKRHLHIDLPSGHRLVPDNELSLTAKRVRTVSLKASAERRSKWRAGGGTVVSRRDAFRSAARAGPPKLTDRQDQWLHGWRPLGWFPR